VWCHYSVSLVFINTISLVFALRHSFITSYDQLTSSPFYLHVLKETNDVLNNFYSTLDESNTRITRFI